MAASRYSPDASSAATWQVVGLLDEDGRLLFTSAAAASVLGANSPKPGEPFGECLVPQDCAQFTAALQTEARGELTVRTLASTSPSRSFRCRFTSLRDDAARRTTLLELCDLASLRDDASEREARLALEHKTAELQAILRALPDLFFRFDADGRFLDFSAPSQSALYAPPEQFLGKHPREVMPADLAEAMERARRETHARGQLASFEYELLLGSELQQFEARYVPFLERQTIAIVRNVTEGRKAEAELRASELRLHEAQKLDAVGRLAGGVAHDFNNLLMVIYGHAFAVARHLTPDHAGQRSLTEIRETCRRASVLTRQLLALTKRRPALRAVLDLREVLPELDSMLSRVIGEHITLSTQLTADLCPVWADRAQIEQVVLNLVLNARDAMPTGGTLIMRAYNVTEPSEPARVALSVSDNGCGMDDETQKHIFEPFFTTKAHGTGLGLFTVARIAQESGARIEVTSRRGVGTTVVLELPAADGTAEPEKREPAHAPPVLGGDAVVLVVEDEDAVRALVVSLLRDLGYQVHAAGSTSEALALAVELRSVDLLLTDVVMPGMSGWELASQIRERYPACKVMYMSGHPIEAPPGSQVVQGPLLHKPFTPEALAGRIRELLRI